MLLPYIPSAYENPMTVMAEIELLKYRLNKLTEEVGNLPGGDTIQAEIDKINEEIADLNTKIDALQLSVTADATVDDTTDNPSVQVTATTVDGKTNLDFAFSGIVGAPGEQGIQGVPGAIGPEGPAGERGPMGPEGPKGEDGKDGVTPDISTTATYAGDDGGDPYAMVTDNGTLDLPIFDFTFGNLRGPKGDTGATGPEGPAGERGPMGPEGPKGEDGKDGVTPDISTTATYAGDDGGDPYAMVTDNGTLDLPIFDFTFGNLRGPKGDTGATGPVGPAGEQGPEGPQGPTGPAGASIGFAGSGIDVTAGEYFAANKDGMDFIAERLGQDEVQTLVSAQFVYDVVNAVPAGPEGPAGPQGPAGETGTTPDISISAIVDDTTGSPKVVVLKSGTPEEPVFELEFSGLKGEPGTSGGGGTQWVNATAAGVILSIPLPDYTANNYVRSIPYVLQATYNNTPYRASGVITITHNGNDNRFPYNVRDFDLPAVTYELQPGRTIRLHISSFNDRSKIVNFYVYTDAGNGTWESIDPDKVQLAFWE